jgi:hypothetical protein
LNATWLHLRAFSSLDSAVRSLVCRARFRDHGFRHKQGLLFRDRFRRQAHPHYGRFLKLQPNALLEITWLTAATLGAETW